MDFEAFVINSYLRPMKIQVEDKEFQCFIEYEQIKKRIRLLGIQLNVDYENRKPVFIGVLNGSFIFLSDLMKEVNIPAEIHFIKVASYKNDSSTGFVKDIIGLNIDLKGRDVVIVEDIVDSGVTLQHIMKQIKAHEPASIAICTLLLKPKALKVDLGEIPYVGFEISNEFVVGYGLDYNGLGRNLKDIYQTIKPPSES